jgi:hypothetical protein
VAKPGSLAATATATVATTGKLKSPEHRSGLFVCSPDFKA